MKFGIFVHTKRPKVPIDKIIERVRCAGASYSKQDPDIAIVVGGDGTFGYYGRTLSIPLLFVGVRESGALPSQARLSEIFYEDLVRALNDIEDGRYSLVEKRMLSARLKRASVSFLTDVYLERGRFAGCLRYATAVRSSRGSKMSLLTDYAIGNGIIISTSFGAGGYFSYPERLESPKREKIGSSSFGDNMVGICHILPTYLIRKSANSQAQKIRYTVPFNSTVRIKLLRDTDARLYGATIHSKGIAVGLQDTITITPSKLKARIIKLWNS